MSRPVPPARPRVARRSAPWLSLLIATVLAACTGSVASPSPSPSTTRPASATATASPTPSSSPSPSPSFPTTVTDDEGTAIALATSPQRVVSLTPAVTETLFALGYGSHVVATDDSSDYPADAASLPDVVTFGKVDVEGIVNLAPDLVIAGGLGFTPADSITQLRSLGLNVLVVYAATIDGVYHDIDLVGQAVGASAPASAMTATMRTEMDAISAAAATASTAAGPRPRVFYDVGYIDATGQIYGPAEGSFLAEMIGRLGVDVITADRVTYEIPLETLIQRDPQVIILGVNAFYAPTPQIIARRTGWKVLTAVKDGEIRSVNDTEITRPGPRLATGLRNLALAMYPDLKLPTP